MIFNENSKIYEVYRNIRTNIVFSKENENIKSILVTSYQKNEGKTTVASNIAIALSNIGKNVLIIDGDLRNPNINNVFNAKNDVGISNIFNNNVELSLYTKNVKENLDILTAGKSTNKSSEIISSIFMKRAIEKFKELYDYVIIDSHSLNLVSDASVLSTYCDGTILVASSGEVNIEDIKLAKENLINMGANILGVVLNKYE